MTDTLTPPQTFRKTSGIHRVGLAAARPAAADVLIGTLYFATDTGALTRSDGTTWGAYAGTTVAAHHTTHEPGGTDELLIGRWTDVPFNAANFLTNTGTWTVDATAVLANRYTRLGNLLIWQLYISWTTGTSVVAGSPTLLGVTAPGGVTFLPNAYQMAAVVVDGGARTETTTDVAAVTTYFTVGHKNNSIFATGPVGFVATMTWGIV